MDFIPLNGNVLARQFKTSKEKTESGIYLPTSAQEEGSGEIRAMVMVKSDDSISPVEEGDSITVAPHAIASGIRLGGDPYILVHESDILGYEKAK